MPDCDPPYQRKGRTIAGCFIMQYIYPVRLKGVGVAPVPHNRSLEHIGHGGGDKGGQNRTEGAEKGNA